MFIFKLILSLLGGKLSKALGHHPGSGFLIGLVLGHFLDVYSYKRFMQWRYQTHYLKKAKIKAEYQFREAFFTLAGKICLADGKISENELAKIEEISLERLKIKKREFKSLKKIFLSAGSSKIPIQSLGIKLVELFAGDPVSIKNVLFTLKELALVDGGLNSQEYKSLFTLSSVFGFSPDEINEILGPLKIRPNSQHDKINTNTSAKSTLEQKLEIIGCKVTDNNDQIRRKYREMISKFHPDKVSAKDLPQDFIDFAEKRFNEIKLAYDYIRKERQF